MAWWPFGRKRKKNKRQPEAPSVTATEKPNTPANFLSARSSLPHTATSTPRQPLSEKPTRPNSPEQARKPATAAAPLRKPSAEDITALPLVAQQRASSPHLRQTQDPSSRTTSLARSSRLNRDLTLSGKKKRRDSHGREEQIRQMSAPIPIPKSSADDSASGFFRRSSTRKRSLVGPGLQQQSSVVSLPAASIRSSITGMSESPRYEIGVVDVLSARPTIRYSWQPNQPWASGANPRSTAPSRAESRKGKGKDKEPRPLSRKTLREGRTIDNLADEYDAHGIRELMERDQRRRDRRRKAQEDQARRRLERAVARQEENRGSSEDQSPFAGLGLAGIEAGPSSPVTPLRRPMHPLEREMMEEERARKEAEKQTEMANAETGAATDPFSDPIQNPTDKLTEAAPPTGLPTDNRFSQNSASPMASPTSDARKASTFSQVSDPRSSTASPVAGERRTSETSVRRGGALATLFRRGGANKRTHSVDEQGRFSPSAMSFSNTSRESMSKQQIPAHLRERPSAPQMRIGMPTRTRSKFREDLPESPVSLPGSRVQSPEPGPVPPMPIAIPGRSAETPEGVRSGSRTASPVEAMLSRSLASVDSEASWLSGRPTPRKRASTQLQTAPSTVSEQPESATSRGETELEQVDGSEQVKQDTVTRQPTLVERDEQHGSNNGLPKQPEEEEEEAKDRPGEGDDDDDRGSMPATPGSQEVPGQFPRTSSEYGGEESPPKKQALHARQVSSGSARLLDIMPKSPTAQVAAGKKQEEE